MDAAHRRLCLGLLAPLALVGCRSSGILPDQVVNNIRAQSPDGPKTPAAPVVVPSPEPAAPAPASRAAVANVVPPSRPGLDQADTQVRVVAMIGSDVVITDDEVWQMVRQKAGDYVRLTGTERDAREKELFREELRKLIERELVIADFLAKVKKNKPQLVQVIKEDADRQVSRQIRDIKKQHHFTTEAQFDEALRSQGISAKALERQLERNAMMNMYLGQFFKDRGKVVSLAEVVRYYREHPAEFKVEDRVKWLDLFVSYRRFDTTVDARRYAENLLAQIRGGADFVQVVKQHGHGDSALRGGEGVGEKRGEVTPRELEPTLFALSPGQISELIATETGFHAVKVLERDVAGVRPFDETVQTYIRTKLGAEAQKVEYDKLIEDLWRKTNVEVIGVP